MGGGGGFVGANPFAGLDAAEKIRKQQQQQQQTSAKQRKGSNATVAAASSSSSSNGLDAEAAAERRRQRNREKRARKKRQQQAAKAAANGKDSDDDDDDSSSSSEDEEEEKAVIISPKGSPKQVTFQGDSPSEDDTEDEDESSDSSEEEHDPAPSPIDMVSLKRSVSDPTASMSPAPSSPAATESDKSFSSPSTSSSSSKRRPRPSPLAMQTDRSNGKGRPTDRVPTPGVAVTINAQRQRSKSDAQEKKRKIEEETVLEEDEEDDEDEDEEETSESEEEESEEEDSDEEDAEAIARQLEFLAISQAKALGYSSNLISKARSQLVSSGIPINEEMLLLAIQQDEALADGFGKHAQAASNKKKQNSQQQKGSKASSNASFAPKANVSANGKVSSTSANTKRATAESKVQNGTDKQRQGDKKGKVTPASSTTAIPASVAASSSTSAFAAPSATTSASIESTPPPPPRDVHTVVGLERSARAWSPLQDSGAALTLLNEWCELLEKASKINATANIASSSSSTSAFCNSVSSSPSDADSTATMFATNFQSSQALELVCRTAVVELYAPGGLALPSTSSSSSNGPTTTRTRSTGPFDAALCRLFVSALHCRSVDARFVLDSFKSIGRQLAFDQASSSKDSSNASASVSQAARKKQLLDQLAKVVATQRKVAAVQRQMQMAIEKEQQARFHSQTTSVMHSPRSRPLRAPLSVSSQAESAALAKLKEQHVDVEQFFGATPSASAASASSGANLRHLWVSSFVAAQEAQRSDELLSSATSLITSSPMHSLQLAFHLLERDINDKLAAAARASEVQAAQVAAVQAQRTTLDVNQARELSSHQTAQREQETTAKELLARKSALLAELATIDTKLDALNLARERTSKSIAGIEAQYSRHRSTLESMRQETMAVATSYEAEARAAQSIHTFIVGSYERLSAAGKEKLQRLVDAHAQHTASFLQSVCASLTAATSLASFLHQRVSFCRSKLETLNLEKKQAAQFGLSLDSFTQAEHQLAQSVAQDGRVLSSMRSNAMQLLRRTYARLTAARAPIPPQQLAQMVGNMINNLESKLAEVSNGSGSSSMSSAPQPLFDLTQIKQLHRTLEQAAEQAANDAAAAEATPSPSPSPSLSAASIESVASPTASPALTPASPSTATSASPAPSSSSSTTSSDPFIVAMHAQSKPQRQSFAARRREREAAKKQQQKQPEATSAPATANGNTTARATSSSASATVAPAPRPVRSWATNNKNVPPSSSSSSSSSSPPSTSAVAPATALSADSTSFPALSTANIQKAKDAEAAERAATQPNHHQQQQSSQTKRGGRTGRGRGRNQQQNQNQQQQRNKQEKQEKKQNGTSTSNGTSTEEKS